MNRKLKLIVSILLCIVLTLSLLLALFAQFFRHTVFNEAYYQQVTAAPDYLPLVYHSIQNDLLTQSNFVAIPHETLQKGLKDDLVYIRLRNHVLNAVAFLNQEEDFTRMDYPAEVFYEELTVFIEAHAQQEGYPPNEEQYELLAEVAEDSAQIVSRHINLINLDLVREMGAFQRIHQLFYQISHLALPALGFFLLASLLLLLLHGRNLSRSLLHWLTAVWMAGSFLLVPAVVMESFGLTRRLAIETPYLKYAIDALLTYANRYLLYWGLILVIFCSAGLVARIFLDHSRRRKKKR